MEVQPDGPSPAAAIAAGSSRRTWLGTPTPIVSASMISSAPAAAIRPTWSTTTPGSTRPSNGQPNAAPSVAVARRPASWAAAIMAAAPAAASSTVVFWLRCAKVSVTG